MAKLAPHFFSFMSRYFSSFTLPTARHLTLTFRETNSHKPAARKNTGSWIMASGYF